MIKTIKSWEDLNSVEMIYKAIRWKELDMGEDFIDQNESIVKEVPFATWLLGRGYINKEQLNSFLDSNYMYSGLQSLLGGYDEPYCVFPYGECEEESCFKKYHVLAEYISQMDNLRKRLFRCLVEDEDNESIMLDESFFEKTENDFGTVHDEWVWVCNNTITDVNKILIERNRE